MGETVGALRQRSVVGEITLRESKDKCWRRKVEEITKV